MTRYATTSAMNGQPGIADDVRTRVHDMWASVADSWGEHADYVESRAAAVTTRLLTLTNPTPGERVLELACGAGGVGLAASPLVGPTGAVVLSDVVDEMTSIAEARAAAMGLTNVSTCRLDLERIEQPDDSFDVVVCREGLMFAPDPLLATREIRRILRSGGRTALAVWGPRQHNPWLTIVLDAVSAQLGSPVPPPGVPGPFSLDDVDKLHGLLSGAGLADVVVSELAVPMHADSFEQWWTRTSALAGPLANMLASLPQPVTQALRARLIEATRSYETPTGLEFPGISLIASARCP